MKKKNINLGILFSLGNSLTDLKKNGQDIRFINEYLRRYSKGLSKVYVFSYAKEQDSYFRKRKIFPSNCFLLENKFSLHRFLYQFFIPFIYYSEFRKTDIFRAMQLTGVVPAILARIFYQKPFIFTYGYDYSDFAKLEEQRIRSNLLKILEKLAMKFSLGVIVTNKEIKSYLENKYPKTKLFYIPNGVDIKNFKPKNDKLRLIAKKSKIRILSIARLERQKNLENLIKAAALLRNKYRLELVFLGQGRLKPQLVKLASKLVINLRIIERVAYDKIGAYYHRTDIFCLPSLKEGHPKALLEAMASGLPCLIGKYAGVKELKNKEEVLQTGFKAKEIAHNLDFLAKNNGLRKKLIRNGRKKIVKDFNIEKLLGKEIKILSN